MNQNDYVKVNFDNSSLNEIDDKIKEFESKHNYKPCMVMNESTYEKLFEFMNINFIGINFNDNKNNNEDNNIIGTYEATAIKIDNKKQFGLIGFE